MGYQGVKFRTEVIGREVPQSPPIKELRYWCRKFSSQGFAPVYEGGSYGNLSFRLQESKDQFIITASGIDLGEELSDDCFVKVENCDLKKGVVYASGEREPSSESILHFAIYHERKDVNAIFHGHSKNILEQANELGIPQTSKEEPYGTIELVQKVLEILDDKAFLIMKNHGFISLGRTMREAGELALRFRVKTKIV